MQTYIGRRERITEARWRDHHGWAAYEAKRLAATDQDEPRVYVTAPDGVEIELAHDLYHSPTGFEWGYYGSGPADLARSILKDVLGHTPRCYQRFKAEVVAKFDREGFTLSAIDVVAWIDRQPEEDILPFDNDDVFGNMSADAKTVSGDLR